MLLLDIVSMAAAFILGLLVRYRGDVSEWQLQLYYTFFIYDLFVYLFLCILRPFRRGDDDLSSCDALDVALHVVRERFLQYIAVILLLTLSHNFQRISRLALLYIVLLDVVISSALRLVLRGAVRSTQRRTARIRVHYVIVTTKEERTIACRRLSEVMPEDADCAGVVLVEPGDAAAVRRALERSLEQEGEDSSFRRDGGPGAPEGAWKREDSKDSSYTEYYEIHCSEDYRMAGARGRVSSLDVLQHGGADLPVMEHLPEGARVFVYLGGAADAAVVDRIVRFYRQHGIPVSARLFMQGRELPESMIRTDGVYACAQFEPLEKCADVLGVLYAPGDVERAAFEVLGAISGDSKGNLPDNSDEAGRSEQKHSVYEELPPVWSVSECAALEKAPAAVRAACCTPHGMSSEDEDTGAQGTAGVLSGEYICFSNVHTTVMAHDDPSYREVLNGSAYTFPDGAPIARQLRGMGYENCMRVAGPDFMDAVFRATMDGQVGHYFYGSTQETIDKLCEALPKRYPGIRIAGAVSPPFRPETEEEDAASVAAMNGSGAALIWIGLGAPKQEKWMAAHRGRVNGVMLGVGAGFNFFAGTVRRAPKWVQKLGLEWLYRLFQDPKRLANRYIITNAKYVWYMMTGAGERDEK